MKTERIVHCNYKHFFFNNKELLLQKRMTCYMLLQMVMKINLVVKMAKKLWQKRVNNFWNNLDKTINIWRYNLNYLFYTPKNQKASQTWCLRGFFCSGDRTRTYDLRVMSPTSYQLLHPAIYF